MGKRKADAGNYDKRMTLQEPTETNTQGTVTTAWSEVATLWCALWPVRGREYYDSKIIQSDVSHIIRCWYRWDISPTSLMQLVYGSRTFQIESVIDVDEQHVEWEFRVVEQL